MKKFTKTIKTLALVFVIMFASVAVIACSNSKSKSKAVLALTDDINKATSSIRISISHLTTKDEIEKFINCFDVCYKELTNLR